MAEKTEFQQVNRAQRRLSSLNPVTLGNIFPVAMAKLKLKPHGIGLRLQTGEVVVDLTAEAVDLTTGETPAPLSLVLNWTTDLKK